VKHDPTPLEPPTPKNSTSWKRKRPPLPPPKPKPRSAGFVFRSKISNTANFSEFADVHQTNKLIRTFFDESRQERPKDESEAIYTRHQHFRRQIKKMLQIYPSSQQEAAKGATTISTTSMVAQQTPGGRKYGQIVTGHPYDVSLNVSTYDVNKRRAASAATQGTHKRNTAVKDAELDHHSELPSDKQSNGLLDSKQKQPAQEVRDDTKIRRGFNNKKRKETVVPAQPITDIPKSHIDAPVIPSPRKSVLNHDLGFASNWVESFSASQESEAKQSPSQKPISRADNEPVSRDLATSGPNLFQRLRDNRRRSRSPEKRAEAQDAVAGLSHNYPPSAFPSFRQRIEDLRASNARNESQIPTAPPLGLQHPPPAPPSSPIAIASEVRPMLRPSPIIEHHSKPPSVVSAESAAEDVQSDTSSGVVSNAQSAVFMRGQIGTGHYHAANTRKPPMPGPPPTGALPSLPEGHDSVAPTTSRISESSPRANTLEKSPATVAVPPKSPRRAGYRFFPSDCSPPKVKQPASPERLDETAPEQLVAPSSTQMRVKRQGVSFPRPDQLPKSVSVGDLDQWQQQRKEKTKTCKARDLARTRSHKATIEDVDCAFSRETSDVEHHRGIAVLPSISNSFTSKIFSARHKPHASQASDTSLSTTLQNRESSTLSQRLSPIMVVAEQEPTSPIPRMSSEKSQCSHRNTINEDAVKSRFSRESTEEAPRIFQTNGFHPGPAHPVSPSLQLPEDEEVKARPLSAHSMPTSRPVASRTPTPFTHSLLRAQSNRSSNRVSMHEVQISELEARLSAIEKKNVMLERAFLAVINTSAAYGGFGGGGGASGIHDGGERLSNGGSSNGNGGSAGERSSGGSVICD